MGNIAVLRADEVLVEFSGFELTDFPSTGTYISMQKLDPYSTLIQGLKGAAIFVRNRSTAYQVDITVLAGTDSDAWMSAATKLARNADLLFSMSVSSVGGGISYISGSCDIMTMGNRDLAGDTSGNIVWSVAGLFPVANVLSIANPGTATSDDITPFLS